MFVEWFCRISSKVECRCDWTSFFHCARKKKRQSVSSSSSNWKGKGKRGKEKEKEEPFLRKEKKIKT